MLSSQKFCQYEENSTLNWIDTQVTKAPFESYDGRHQTHLKLFTFTFRSTSQSLKCLYKDITKSGTNTVYSLDSVCNIIYNHNSCTEIIKSIIDRKVDHNTLVVYAYDLVENYDLQ